MGFRVALVSDAGTPTISDPGFKLTQAAHKEGIAVEALPGPCAITTALSASGLPGESFQFLGYVPKNQTDREDIFIRVANQKITSCFYESPNRLQRTLATIEEILGSEHEVFVGIELTKLHETHYRGPVGKVLEQIQEQTEGSKLKGEVTLLLAPGDDENRRQAEEARGLGFDVNKDS